MKNVTVAGGGVLGSQIAFQSAYKGYDVTVWLRSEGSIGRSRPKFERLKTIYLETLDSLRPLCGSDTKIFPRGLADNVKELTPEKIDELKAQVENAFDSIRFELDPQKAVQDADLIIECVAEDPQSKIDFYEKIAPYVKKDGIIVTNSSTLLPSQFAQYTGRPDKYLALHFANEIWKNNTAEIMRTDKTDPEEAEKVAAFAESIGMVPLRLNKEQPGYILNSLLVPLLNAAQNLYVNGVADPKTIDLTWMLATGAPMGPFRILDVVGLETAYNISKMNPDSQKIAEMLKKMIDEGKTGVNAGEGFYKYK